MGRDAPARHGAQTVRLDGANLEVRFADGEEIRTEISAKFTRDAVERELRAAGLRLDDFFSDGAGLFGLAFAWRSIPPPLAFPRHEAQRRVRTGRGWRSRSRRGDRASASSPAPA